MSPPWDARSSSSPPTSSATTRSVATAGRSRARPWSMPRRQRRQLPAGLQPERGVHAGAVHDADGQYVRTHGVVANGVALPPEAPTSPRTCTGRLPHRTVGEAHFEPALRPAGQWEENRMAPAGRDRSVPRLRVHRAGDARAAGPPALRTFIQPSIRTPREASRVALGTGRRRDRCAGGGYNPIPRDWYHTDWVADRTIAWLDSLAADAHWFCWLSFPDPHHPWDPPASEATRVTWRDLDLPPGSPGLTRPDRRDARSRSRSIGWRGGRVAGVTRGRSDGVPAEGTSPTTSSARSTR